MPTEGTRVLSMGVDAMIGAAGQDALRRAGLRATVITVTDDAAGDEVLRSALRDDDDYEAVGFGAGLSGQAPPEYGATPASTVWFNRLLNIVHTMAPGSSCREDRPTWSRRSSASSAARRASNCC